MFWAQQEYTFTTANGLPSNTVYDVVQDAKGFIWIATSKGLVKYNGKAFKNFTVQEGLPNNDTWKLEVTPDGKVWYFAKSNRQGYIENDSIYSFPVENEMTVSPAFFITVNNKVGFVFSSTHFLTDNQWQTNYTLNDTIEDGNYRFLINDSTLIERDNTEYVISNKRNKTYEKKYSIPVPFPVGIDPYASNPTGVYNKTLWQLFDEGLMLIDYHSGKSEVIHLKTTKRDSAMFVWANSKNIQWKSKEALKIFDHNFELIKTIYHPGLEKSTRAIVDKDGNLWLCSLSQGLRMIPAATLNNQYYFEGQKVQKLQQLEDSLFVGIFNNTVHYYDDKGFSPTQLQPKGNIYKLKRIPPYGKYVIAGTKGDSDYKTLKRKQLFVHDGGTSNNQNDIIGFRDLKYYNDRLYLLQHYRVAYRKNEDKFKLLQNTQGQNGFVQYNDSLFLYGSDGLYFLENDAILPYPVNSSSYKAAYLTALCFKNKLLLGSDGFGVQVLEEGRFTNLEQTEGLSVNRIIQKDSLLWLATQKGVQVLQLESEFSKSKIIDAYYVADGLLDQNINDIEIRDSLLFVATDLGLSKINLKNPTYKQTPKLYFNSVSDTIAYNYEEAENLSISFGTLAYNNQENFSYQYRLLPEQTQWQTIKTQEITFSQIPPGNHQLEVSVIDQHQNQSEKSLYIKIIPRWWQTTSFKVLAGLGVLILFIGLGWLTYRIAKKTTQQKAERERQLAALELQALRSQMNPHFVHNSLNAIQYYVQRNDVALSEKYLSKFSKLIRQFFEFSRKQTISISEEKNLLSNYLEIEKLRFEDKIDYVISLDDNIDAEETQIPSMVLQPIVENAINHGIFHKEGKGIIKIDFKREGSRTLLIEIEDDGIGIERAKEIYKSSDRNYRSNSTEVLKERLELLQHNKQWNIDYSIKDLKNITSGNGTRVTLHLSIPDEN